MSRALSWLCVTARVRKIARSDEVVREQADSGFGRRGEWAQILQSDSLAWPSCRSGVGALVVARMLDTPKIQRQVLQASHEETAASSLFNEYLSGRNLLADDDQLRLV